MVSLPDYEAPEVLVPEDIPGFHRRTCSCGRTTVMEPDDLPEAQRARCPICETSHQTVISGHLLDVTQLGLDQSTADDLRNGRIVLVVDE